MKINTQFRKSGYAKVLVSMAETSTSATVQRFD